MNFRIILILCLLFCISRIESQHTDPVKIGLLIQNQESQAAKQGAELAVNNANKKGGFNGRPFLLITKDMEGPWGTGSKQAVDLIFEDEVWALLGSHDGRNAHLVEQASAKSIIPFVSAWSSDATLSQAFIPWFFNCVPTDDQQAVALIDEIYSKRKFSRVATLTDNSYDSNQSLKSFLKFIKKDDKVLPFMFGVEEYQANLNVLADQVIKKEVDCIVLFCQPATALKIVRLVKEIKMQHIVFSTFSILNENELSLKEIAEFRNILIPAVHPAGSNIKAFVEQYLQTYGKIPGMVASYAFDGMNILIEAIRTSGSSERENIQEALSRIRYDGVTGLIQFDSMGNRKGIPAVLPFQKSSR